MRPLDETGEIECARSEPESFAEIYRLYLPRVYRYLYIRLGNQPDAEDITSQVFLETMEALRHHRYEQKGCFPAWLFTIVRRRLSDFRRKSTPLLLREQASAEPGPLDEVQRRDTVQRLDTLVSQLEPEKQELLRLRFAAELSFAEIAAVENQNEAAVTMAIYRALKWLRERWEADHG
jgi:RNA polymerase sigma-70 factor (ECF subfamily)